MSDTPLTDCPQCGAATFKKQLTAAGFQLKGSGWYVTDFRDGKGGGDKAKESGCSDKADVPASAVTAATTTPAKSETSTAAAAPAASPTPAPKAAT